MGTKIGWKQLALGLAIGLAVGCGSGDGDDAPDGPVDAPGVEVIALEARDGADGFLWKPESEKNRRLVVLLPTAFNAIVSKVEIHRESVPSETSFVEISAYSGLGNGNRSHWRFTQPGGAYGSNVYVMVFTHAGEVFSYLIANGQHRVD